MAKKPEKVEKDLTKEREEKLAPVAQEIIEMIANAKLPIGETHAHDNGKFDHVAGEVLKLMLKHEVKYADKSFLFQLVLQPFDIVKETVHLSLTKSFDLVINRALKKDFGDVTLKDMDQILKKTNDIPVS